MQFIMIVSFEQTILCMYISALDNIVQIINLSFFFLIGLIPRDFKKVLVWSVYSRNIAINQLDNLLAETYDMDGIGFNVGL